MLHTSELPYELSTLNVLDKSHWLYLSPTNCIVIMLSKVNSFLSDSYFPIRISKYLVFNVRFPDGHIVSSLDEVIFRFCFLEALLA